MGLIAAALNNLDIGGETEAGEERDSGERTMGYRVNGDDRLKNFASDSQPPSGSKKTGFRLRTMGVDDLGELLIRIIRENSRCCVLDRDLGPKFHDTVGRNFEETRRVGRVLHEENEDPILPERHAFV
jgi:hypothetical protein